MVDPRGIFVTVDAASAQEDLGTEDRGSDTLCHCGKFEKGPPEVLLPTPFCVGAQGRDHPCRQSTRALASQVIKHLTLKTVSWASKHKMIFIHPNEK